jgi:prophage antirepressor-like protein
LFRAIDIGEILEMTNIIVIMKSFDDDDRKLQIIDTSTGPKQVNFLTEKGLYKVL